jgi:phenylpropionate dioxygenase-like ring-hydroxylating dioxygenase large terminal subunit
VEIVPIATPRRYCGWHQVAFERELRERLTPVAIGSLPLALVREQNRIQAIDAICPHRGAHLAYGGRLDGDAIVCPFHGHCIGIGESAQHHYRVRDYRVLSVGGLVFVLLNERHENGFSRLMQDLDRTHFFVQGFTLVANAPAELVVENGFDGAHFECVHGLRSRPELRLLPSNNGALVVRSDFRLSAFRNAGRDDAEDPASADIRFLAQVFSPNLCVTHLGEGETEQLVISGATPNSDGRCTIRVSVAVPARTDGSPPPEEGIRSLLRDSKLAYDQDLLIWEHRAHDAPSRFDEGDDLVIAFHEFCKRFQQAASE